MNVRAMMRIDRWLGVPACALATCLRHLLRAWRSPSAPEVRSLLFIKLAEQGSTVLAYPALQKAVRRVGRENVFMLVFDSNRFIVDVLGVIPPENVATVRTGSFLALLRSAATAVWRLRRIGIDAVVDLEFFSRFSALLAYLAGAQVRVGFHAFFGEGPYRGDLMTHRVRYNPHLHTTQSFSLLVEAVDAPAGDLPRFPVLPPPAIDGSPIFVPRRDEIATVEQMLTRYTGVPVTPPLVLLNANASDLLPLRRWSTDSYAALTRLILDRFPEVHVVFTGAPEESSTAEKLLEEVGSHRCFSLAGATTLRQLMILFGLADVLVTNDSGPAHFASLTPIHTVTLFGPETPLLFAAMTPRNTALWAGIACSPCVSALNHRQSPCRDNVCMQRISVAQVFEAVCASYYRRRSVRSRAEAATVPLQST